MPAGGGTFVTGKLSPAEEGRGCPEDREGAMREKLAWGVLLWGERHTAPGGALLFPRRGEEMALPALQHRRVCVQPGLEGRGGGDTMQVTG